MLARFLIILLSILLSACTGQYYKLPSPAFDPAKYEVVGTGKSTSTGIHLFQFIPIGLNNKIENATKQAISSLGGDTITDVVIRERWFWAYILNGYKVDVEGVVLKAKSAYAASVVPQNQLKVSSPSNNNEGLCSVDKILSMKKENLTDKQIHSICQN